MDRDGGDGAEGRRWRGAISVTSHLTAQCFSGRRLVRGRRERESAALLRLDGCSQVASQAKELICLCQREGEEHLCLNITERLPHAKHEWPTGRPAGGLGRCRGRNGNSSVW